MNLFNKDNYEKKSSYAKKDLAPNPLRKAETNCQRRYIA